MISEALLSLCIQGVAIHEGFSSTPYRDVNRDWVIGYGYNMTKNPLHLPKMMQISKSRATTLVRKMCVATDKELSKAVSFYNFLPTGKKYVLLDMSYNLGTQGLLKFDKTLHHVEKHHYALASKEMLNSKWARQVKGRSKDLAHKMS
jgi:lysozyme